MKIQWKFSILKCSKSKLHLSFFYYTCRLKDADKQIIFGTCSRNVATLIPYPSPYVKGVAAWKSWKWFKRTACSSSWGRPDSTGSFLQSRHDTEQKFHTSPTSDRPWSAAADGYFSSQTQTPAPTSSSAAAASLKVRHVKSFRVHLNPWGYTLTPQTEGRSWRGIVHTESVTY